MHLISYFTYSLKACMSSGSPEESRSYCQKLADAESLCPAEMLPIDLRDGKLCVQEELVAAGIFVRVYNEQPSFALGHDEATAFCKGIVTWVSIFSRKEPFCSRPGRHSATLIPALSAPGTK